MTEAPPGSPPRSAAPAGTPGVGRSLVNLVTSLTALVVRGLRRLREWNRRDGAGASGLAQLVEVHVLQTGGDAMVAVALAGSLFFSVPTHEARSRVALFLLVTFVPFVVVAAVIGPVLDRFRRGRRIALMVTMAARAVLAIAIGHSLSGGTAALTLYPAALGLLIASKAYTVARAAAVPRLTPAGMSLVSANSRLTIAGVIAPAVAGAFAIAVRSTLGTNDELLVAAASYVVGAVFSMRLPRHADGGHEPVVPAAGGDPNAAAGGRSDDGTGQGRRRLRLGFPAEVRRTLTSAAALRWLSGFCLLYGAFVVREHPLGGLSANFSLAALGAGILVGNFLGTAVGARIRGLRTPRMGLGLLVVAVVVDVLAAWKFGLVTAFLLSLVGAATAAMTKLALDATIQERVADSRRSSTFGRSETAMQLAWALGGVIGILLPTDPRVGFGIAGGVLALATVRAAAA